MGNVQKVRVDSVLAAGIRAASNQHESISDEHKLVLGRLAELEQEARAIRRLLQNQSYQLQNAESAITNLRYGLDSCGNNASKVGSLLKGLESNLSALRKYEGMMYD